MNMPYKIDAGNFIRPVRWKRIGRSYMIPVLLILFGLQGVYSQNDLGIWKQFITGLKNGTFTVEQIRPLYVSREVLLEQLMNFKNSADKMSTWSDWDAPRVFPVGDKVHFVVSLGFGDGAKSDFCFSFLKEADNWFYTHLENIFIRLDKTPSPPTSEFPDLPEETKAWQREEIYWSQMIYLYSVLAREKGKEFFFNLLKDGQGYFVAAKTWVPFVEPQKAFILYLCWEQANLRGNEVVLEKLDEHEAIVRIVPQYFQLWVRTAHLKQYIEFEDYAQIFMTIWEDRAEKAGWDLTIEWDGALGIFRFESKDK